MYNPHLYYHNHYAVAMTWLLFSALLFMTNHAGVQCVLNLTEYVHIAYMLRMMLQLNGPW